MLWKWGRLGVAMLLQLKAQKPIAVVGCRTESSIG